MELTAVRQSDLAHPRGDVIFVHGLDGDARSTWQAKGQSTFSWPSGLAEELPGHSVWTLGYAAPVSSWRSTSSPLLDLATDGLSVLEAHGIGERPLVFIAHSFGGLLVKQMLRCATSYGNARWQALHDHVCGIVFLATPHTGATAANWLLHLRSVLRASVSVKELEAHNPQLRDLNLWFRSHTQKVPIPLQVYCERHPTHGLLVVDPASGDPGITGVTPIMVDADHTSIAKPRDRSATLCLRVRRFIEHCSAAPDHADRLESRIPSGTVTFLFTDVEGSTQLLEELGEERYVEALTEHRRLLREAFRAHTGVEVDTQGDSFLYVFADPGAALAAAAAGQDALASGPLKVRMGMHTGVTRLTDEGYAGRELHRAARIAASGHGGQVLVSAASAEAAGVGGLRELGKHRLKDFDQPVPLYQLGEKNFPPLRTISQTNLPRPASSFVGRERELGQVIALLQDGARLVTLSGPGGSGKTRLAIEAASELVPQFKSGVFWVGLATLRDPALVAETIAQTLEAQGELAEHIGQRDMLLLLDNLEQVVEAAPELGSLLECCPNLKLVVTSRELLRIRGEVEYAVPPLSEDEAVELFCARARLEADETVAEVCRRLDNLPLALELAAARVSVLSPAQILERLSKRLDLLKGGRDMAARQQTLRAAIEWSHDLLVPEEKRLFARLAVFRGGCTLEAAEEVADADLDLLQSLVDKSLLRHTSDRFQMLETIHEYALERLADSDEATAIRDRHGAFFVALAERAYEGRSSSAERWFQVMDDEVDNFRAVLDWARDTSPETEAQLAGALGYYWSLRGSVREARDRFEGALGRHSLRDRTRARALTFHAAAMGMDTASVAPLEEALSIFREHGDPLGEAMARERLAYKYIAFGEEDAARHAFEKSLALREAAGADEAESWYALGGLCQLLVAAGDAAQAEPLARELYRVGKLHGRLDTQGDALHYLADCALIPGDYLEAERRYRRSLAHAWRCGIWGQAVEELRGFAMSLAGQGDASRAVMLAALATAHREALGRGPLSPSHWWGRLQERLIGSARAALAPDVGEEAECTGSKADFDAVVEELIGAEAS